MKNCNPKRNNDLPYYKAVRITDDKGKCIGAGKLLCHGRKIEINGCVFFTESHARASSRNTWLTEARTGYGLLKSTFLKKENEAKEKLSRLESVQSFPEAEYDGDGTFGFKKKRGKQ